MARTRSAKGTTAAPKPSKATTTSRYSLSEESQNPCKLLILPVQATKEARIVTLPNPRYSKPTRYLVCPETGIYEFTKISAPKATPRSWLIVQEDGAAKEEENGTAEADRIETTTAAQAQVTKGAEFFIATKIDPVFLVLPGLIAGQASGKSEPAKRMFLSSDDHFDNLAQSDSHLSEVLRWGKTRELLEARMTSVCDTVDAGDETMFRLNEAKLLELLLSKSQRITLPKSMEEKFVTKALEAPVLARKSMAPRGDAQAPAQADSRGSGDSDASTPQTEANDSQTSVSTIATLASAVSEASTAATSLSGDDAGDNSNEVAAAMQASEEVVRLQRLRTAFSFICSSYLPPSLTAVLKKQLQETPAAGAKSKGSSAVDFAPLDAYLARLVKLRQEATAARSASDFSRKRALDDEEEAERAEKKRKKDEDDKRKKAGESRGVRELKKVNVSGMKKMSDFFKKKPS